MRCNSIRCNLIMAIRCEWMSVSMVIMQKRDGSVLMKLCGARTGRVIGQQISSLIVLSGELFAANP